MTKSRIIKDKNKLVQSIEIDGKEYSRPIRIFIVELLRWGDKESHHYITGTFSTYKAALKNAKEAMENRGGKYDAKISEAYIDDPSSIETYRVIQWGDEY